MLSRKQLRERPVADHLQGLHAALHPLSGVMMRHSLGLLGLKVPAVASVPEIARCVVAHVEEGGLTEPQAHELVLDCLEHSNKRAYLFTADVRALRDWEPADARDVVRSRTDVRIKPTLTNERLQYIWADDDRIRICLTEGHTYYERDIATLKLIPRLKQKVIVIDADRRTGAVTLLMDPPGPYHEHGGPLGYKRHFEGRMAALLGTTPEPLPLSRALTRLEDQNLIEIAHSRVETPYGRMALTGGLRADIRQHPQFAELRSSRINYDEDEYIWTPQPADNPWELTIPVRPLKTHITALAGEVRFALHALAIEVRYVLGQLRAHA